MAKESKVAASEGEIDPAETSVGPEAGTAAPASADTAAAPATAKPSAKAATAKPSAKAATASQVIVRVPGNVPQGPPGGHHRVFTAEDHGPDFKEQAKAYAEKYNGEFVAALPAPKVCPSCKRSL